MKEKYKVAIMDMAERFAQTSEAIRLKVASFIYKNDSIISMGINGSPKGWVSNVCEDAEYLSEENEWMYEFPEKEFPYSDSDGRRYKLVTKDIVRHAEVNALDKLRRSSESTLGADIFCTHAPCLNCSIQIVESGINKLYYRHQYRDTSGLEYLEKNGVEIEQVTQKVKKDKYTMKLNHYECSECNSVFEICPDSDNQLEVKFCPYCSEELGEGYILEREEK